jgi:hypothetical protein
VRPSQQRERLLRLLAPLCFATVAIATVGAFALAQKLKSDALVLDKVNLTHAFTPNGDCIEEFARIRFRLTQPDRANVEIVRGDEVARTLARNRHLGAFRFHVFEWNGRTDDGERAPVGPYRVRVTMLTEDRTLIPGGFIRLHKRPFIRDGCPGPGGVAVPPGTGAGGAR